MVLQVLLVIEKRNFILAFYFIKAALAIEQLRPPITDIIIFQTFDWSLGQLDDRITKNN